MKVCTDACLFGSWVAATFSTNKIEIINCLDIGTGTGLLSLLYAQKNPGTMIDAVEIEFNAYSQAKENFSDSKWNDRLNIFYADINKFISDKKYDLVISNPPFYEYDLRSAETNRILAKHNGGLLLKDLITIIKMHLTSNGFFSVLLPYNRVKYFEDLAGENGFFCNEKVLIRQTPSHDPFRAILLFNSISYGSTTKELTIKNKEGNYTGEFADLLKDYYLRL